MISCDQPFERANELRSLIANIPDNQHCAIPALTRHAPVGLDAESPRFRRDRR